MNNVKSLFSFCLILSIGLLYSCQDQTPDIVPQKPAVSAAREVTTQSLSCEECRAQYEENMADCAEGLPLQPAQKQASVRSGRLTCAAIARQRYQACLSQCLPN